ncbi:polysaccharide biosynthesis tyrosine autokinase [Mucilaginibacter myungsuensis]|uniref:non-specific protein-tyrosine kinase n=1 Tax=Mucilaginibacter myungsuensis TaxID=649104 RepID=A0A929PVA8_9SPHI|nr:tyrosine-protein kinase family protein [Mucilaginibacter myungsuensis]MBE9660816.1 polysaccharide biosynthesis tyrosine autokinase [Mucilaginibacter myungsuensis]MDN3600862.1 polysaccharide biosynthesis tyrosine autokinase [Mucilaginibacter myungsuensis]
MQETNKFQRKLPNQEIDYFKIGKILLSRWYWIAATLLISIGVSKVYLWYTPKVYATGATIKFEDKRSELNDMAGAYAASATMAARMQSELVVLQSSPVLLRAIKSIDHRVSFYLNGRVRVTDIYPQKLLDIQFITLDSVIFFREQLEFRPKNKDQFTLTYARGKKETKQTYSYDAPITLDHTVFTIKHQESLPSNTVVLFKFNAPEDLLGRVRGGLHPGEISRNSNIVAIQQTDVNPVFAADILNAILVEYLKYDKEQRTKSARQTIEFIDTKLGLLSGKVSTSGNELEQFKQRRKMVDISTTSAALVGQSKEIEAQISILNMQVTAIDDLKNKLIAQQSAANINFNISGSVDPFLGPLITSYNALLANRTELLKDYNLNSPPIKDIDRQIATIKTSALANVNSTRDETQKKLNYLNSQKRGIDQQIGTIPAAENDLFKLKRSFEINDKVYGLLEEKRLDAEISSSAILPGASIVDRAYPSLNPISPDAGAVNRKAIIIGIISGLGIIILIRMLNPYIYDKETIESLTTVPIIGVIRKFPGSLDEDSSQLLALTKPRSIFAESVRSVRTNLNFLASDKKNKVICITSEVAGEGKSFVSVNLSSTLALINKRVILIGADLRRSRIHKTFNVPNDLGLSNYLANQATPQDIIKHSEVGSLDFITSGPVPPNPSELLHSSRMAELVEELKGYYDFIIIDTAPVGLVSDSIPLIRASDVNVFVIRSGKSKYYAATVPQRIATEYNLDNSVIVLNAFEEDLLHSRYYTTRITGENYGNRYYYYSDYSGYASSGYYLDDDKRKWWDIKRWLKF